MRSVIAVIGCGLALAGAAQMPWDAPDEAPVTARRVHETWGAKTIDWTIDVEGWVPVAADEHPRLVFRAADIARLRQRAATPEGQAMLARLNTLLDGPFTLWHPAGYGLLYQLTGEQRHADTAARLVIDILDGGRRDERDPRYGFGNPGDGGAMRAGPAIGAVGLAYDLNHAGWPDDLRRKVAAAIQENPHAAAIAKSAPLGPGGNHYGASLGGTGLGLLAIRGDAGTDAAKVTRLLGRVVTQIRDEIAMGYGDHGYYFEGHQGGRISSNTGLLPFLLAYRLAAGKDLVAGKHNARWLSAKWVYEFARNPDGTYTNAQRGMYCRNFQRGGMWSQVGDFALGFAVCPPEYVPALRWVYEHQVEPGPERTYDIVEYPHLAIYALAHWPIDVPARSPQDQPQLFPRVLRDTGSGYVLFRNGWSVTGGDICVSALLGTHQNGRGMASGGSVYVYGKGLGWADDRARYRLPGMFYTSYPTYVKFEPDGSGVISAVTYDRRLSKFALDPKRTSVVPTSLAVDFSGVCGADLLVVMVGPMVGHQVGYWMDITPAEAADVEGQEGYRTRTTAVTLGGEEACVMTLQCGPAPTVKQIGDEVTVGKRRISFDSAKLVLE